MMSKAIAKTIVIGVGIVGAIKLKHKFDRNIGECVHDLIDAANAKVDNEPYCKVSHFMGHDVLLKVDPDNEDGEVVSLWPPKEEEPEADPEEE